MNSHPSSREMTLRSLIILLAPYLAPARSGRLRKRARARRASASALPRASVLDDATRSVLRARAGYERVGDVRSVARGVARARARRSARPRRHGRPRGRATRVAYVYARDEKTVRRASGRGTVQYRSDLSIWVRTVNRGLSPRSSSRSTRRGSPVDGSNICFQLILFDAGAVFPFLRPPPTNPRVASRVTGRTGRPTGP